jgi:hypothetical protein
MRAVFVAPELRQAMLMFLCCEGPLKKRRRFGRNFRVIVVIRTVMKKSFAVGRRGRPGGRIDVKECFFCYTADCRRGKYKNCDDEGLTQFGKLEVGL